MAEYPRHLVREHTLFDDGKPGLELNGDMLRFAHGLGFEVQHVPDDVSVMRIVKRLQAAAPRAHEGARSN